MWAKNGWLSQRGKKRTLWPTPQVKSTKTNPLSLLWIEALTSLQVFGFCLLQHHSQLSLPFPSWKSHRCHFLFVSPVCTLSVLSEEKNQEVKEKKKRRISERKCVFTISTHFLVSGTSYKSALQKIHAQRPIGRTLKARWQCSDSSVAAVYTCTASHVKSLHSHSLTFCGILLITLCGWWCMKKVSLWSISSTIFVFR